jgi:hypothetical protein
MATKNAIVRQLQGITFAGKARIAMLYASVRLSQSYRIEAPKTVAGGVGSRA